MQLGEETTAFHSMNEDSLAYLSLRCKIEVLQQHSEEYTQRSADFLAAMPEGTVLHRIFSLHRPSEVNEFQEWKERWTEKNKKNPKSAILYHASKIENWYSILSRGLILPSSDPLQQII